MFNSLLKAVVGVVVLPVSVVADVVTLGGALSDKKEPYTSKTVSNIVKNLERAGDPNE